MNGFWRVFRRFRWLCLLFALLACLPPQITILAPVAAGSCFIRLWRETQLEV
jgi:hypothetical protein